MPDLWTNHPELVRDLLKEAGFRCGVEGRFLKGRDPAWTCAFDGKTMYGDLYIHHADQLRSERPLDGGPTPPQPKAALDGIGEWSIPAVALLLGVVSARLWPGRIKRP
jgi:hypothetical protein